MGLTEDRMYCGWYEREAGRWTWTAYMLAQSSHRQEIALDDEN